MIVATAGHVDHGKSTLVAALTGQRTDRLPEEQRRGMTIEAGYAHADFGDGAVLDFVDLPGHERYLRHLLAGIAAADVALLVVAADDGPMPQTLEHLALLRALGIARVLPVLSKIDRVDAARVAQVRDAMQQLLHEPGLEPAAVLEVCATRGQGLEAVRSTLRDLHRALPQRDDRGGFRLAVDRVFTRSGAGLVVTGTVLAGRVATADELRTVPGNGAARVRGLQVHGQPVIAARAGQRCALNLAPLAGERLQVDRGDWMMAPPLLAPTRRLDVRWRRPHERALPAQLHLHLGNATRIARHIALGDTAHAQLLLDRPVSALRGDRFVLRDPAARQLLGGGTVLDAFAPARGRARPQRLAELQALSEPMPDRALAAMLGLRREGVEWSSFALNWNLPADARDVMAAAAGALCLPHPGGMRLLGTGAWPALLTAVQRTLAASHEREPASRGMTEAALHVALSDHGDVPLRHAALAQLQRNGAIERDGFVWRIPGHAAQLPEADAVLLQRTHAVMQPHGLRPPPLGELAVLLDLPLLEAAAFLQRAAALGHLVQVARNRFFLPATLQALVQVARETAAASPDGRFEVIPFRDRSGLGRNLSIQVLEYFDRMHITRFAKRGRVMTVPP
ncbi:MAG: selenocysteine-specific translation elongation factor [Burkholderiales bacterium]|nr:selenocysteine-specific translation elongation factor [Burkholderiales bacterium]